MRSRMLCLAALLVLLPLVCSAQDPRGSITGIVTDPQGAIVPGASATVTNTGTNVSNRTQTNQTGYFEVSLLNPGIYSVSVEMAGFKKAVRGGLELNVAARLDIRMRLAVGDTSQTIEVTAAAPLLDTVSAAGGRVISAAEVKELPFASMNPFNLVALSAGMEYTGSPSWSRWFDHAGAASYNTMGSAGNNEYMIDGAPVTGTNGARFGYAPISEAVDEFRLDTAPFDASYGHTAGAVINVSSKSGSNAYHGSLYNQHWQQRWNATPHFTRLQWEQDVAAGRKKSSDPKQNPGRYNGPGASIGGPVIIPKLLNGRDKLFFFFDYGSIWQRSSAASGTGSSGNLHTVPKMAWRQGDFSDLLAVDPVKYTMYDPRTARLSGSRVIRDPFPGNKGVPILNPMYNWYVKLYPEPNNVGGLVSPDGTGNLFTPGQPRVDEGSDILNRIDYNIGSRHRILGKWYWNDRHSSEYDWSYQTPLKGLLKNGLLRYNKGMSADYVWTVNSSTMLDVTFSVTRYNEGNVSETRLQYKPSDLGLPGYINTQAGAYAYVPYVSISGIDGYASTSFATYPGINQRGTTGGLKVAMSTIRGAHSLKYGWEERRYQYAQPGGPSGYTSGNFQFDNRYIKQQDNTTTAANLGLAWASFLMGLPYQASIDQYQDFFFATPYHALYFQDSWRVTNRLRIGYGLRFEREGGTAERYNRGLAGGFDWNYKPPFADAVQAAYARSPIAQLPAGQFKVLGGAYYLGKPYKNYTDGVNNFLPNVSAVFQINTKTVLRTGYGFYADTFNALSGTSTRPTVPAGYNASTSTTMTTDNALTFCCGVGVAANIANGRTVLNDPFSTRADGTRFEQPYLNSLGQDIRDGQSFGLPPRNYKPTLQQRWRLSLQREISKNMVIDASYNGSYASTPMTMNVSYLPAQYWATGTARNQAADDAMNTNVSNPFNIANLSALQTSNPVLYKWLSTQSFFTATTIQVNRLLRAYPLFNAGLTFVPQGVDSRDFRGKNKYHDFELQFQKRFSYGLQSAVMYTRAYGMSTYRANEFDQNLTWQTNNNLRPHRFVWTTIYQLPFGKGRRFINSHPIQHLAGGWQVSWIYQRQNGAALSFGNRFYYGGISQIADLLKHDSVHSKDIHLWFDPSVSYNTALNSTAVATGAIPSGFTGFEGRSAFQPGSYQVRMIPNLIDSMRQDGIRQWDVKIARKLKIHERLSTTFSVDLLNAMNHTNFGAPNLDPTSPQFGRITTSVGDPRAIIFNLRIEF
jgi:hypothetical protein